MFVDECIVHKPFDGLNGNVFKFQWTAVNLCVCTRALYLLCKWINKQKTMECQVRSMSESSACAPESTVPEGRVEAVCREWLVREDGVLAYKLQNEEIEHHYGHNKERNQLVRSDLHEAKVIQRTEQEEAEMMQQAYEQMLLEQENADALVAKEIQEKLLQEELDKQRQIEEEDQRIAAELQRKEKLRLQRKREERELRQVEKLKSSQPDAADSLCKPQNGISLSSTTQEASTSPLDKDFTDLCLEPPSGLSLEEQRRFREEQDAELAKFLQDQELKRRNQHVEDQQLAIEAQDRELAKVLQEQERARARRAKERAKQKAMLQQQQQRDEMSTASENQNHYAVSPVENYESSQTEVKMKDNDCYGLTGGFRGPAPSPSSTSHSVDNIAMVRGLAPSPSSTSHSVDNIAMVLDPTYNRHRPLVESPASFHGSIISSPMHSPHSSPPNTIDSMGYPPSGIGDNFYLGPDDDEAVAPPYMPIQGQRRPQTLEKTKKSKKHKDGCKTQ